MMTERINAIHSFYAANMLVFRLQDIGLVLDENPSKKGTLQRDIYFINTGMEYGLKKAFGKDFSEELFDSICDMFREFDYDEDKIMKEAVIRYGTRKPAIKEPKALTPEELKTLDFDKSNDIAKLLRYEAAQIKKKETKE